MSATKNASTNNTHTTPKETTFDSETIKQLTEELRSQAGGTIFSVCFKKRTNDEIRVMHARFGVKKYLKKYPDENPKQDHRAYDPAEHGLLTVFDVAKQGYRSIPLDSVLWFRIRGRLYRRKSAA